MKHIVKAFEVGKTYKGYCNTVFKVTARTAKSVTIREKGSRYYIKRKIKVNPFKEEENEGVEYIDLGEDTTIEYWASAEEVVR